MLFAALAVVCKCQTEAQKRPRLFEHGGIAERNGKNRHIVEQIKEITDQDSMMLVVETQGHGNDAHDQNNDNRYEIPKRLRSLLHFSFQRINDPNGNKHQSQREHYIVPVHVEERGRCKHIEGYLRYDAE